MMELLVWGYLAFAVLVGFALWHFDLFDDWNEITFSAGVWPVTLVIIGYFWLFHHFRRKKNER